MLCCNVLQLMQWQAVEAVVRKRRAAVAAAIITVAAAVKDLPKTRVSSNFEPRLDFQKFTHKLNIKPGDEF